MTDEPDKAGKKRGEFAPMAEGPITKRRTRNGKRGQLMPTTALPPSKKEAKKGAGK